MAQIFGAADLVRYAGCAHAAGKALRGAGRFDVPEGAQLWGPFAARVSRFVQGAPVLAPGREPEVADLLEVVLASEALDPAPEFAHIERPDGTLMSLRLPELRHYLRGLAQRFVEFAETLPPTRAQPCAACASCPYAADCAQELAAADSLFGLAGIRSAEVQLFEAAGISTQAALAAAGDEVPGMGRAALRRLQAQARVQVAARDGRPVYELRAPEAGRGLALLPEPSAGDVFYRYEEASAAHLLRKGGEVMAFSALADCVAALRDALLEVPEARIYHATSADLVAFRRLCMLEGVAEAWLDQRLREGRFVNLGEVARGALQSSQPGLSAEELCVFWGGAPTDGDAALRDWLLSLRPEGMAWAPALEPAEEAEEAAEDPAERALRELLNAADLPAEMRDLLYNLGRFHARESRPAQWAVFDSQSRDEEALIDDPETLGGLRATGAATPVARSMARVYRYPPQQTKIRAGKSVTIPGGEGAPVTVTVTALDPARREVTLKTGAAKAHLLTSELSLHPDWPLRTDVIAAALQDVIEDYCGAKVYRAVGGLLNRDLPCLTGANLPQRLATEPDLVAATVGAVCAMDHSVLPIQGPPGTGKTYVSARAILALLRQGARVGVASNSHEAVRNVLMGCVAALDEADLPFNAEIIHKTSSGDDGYPETSPVRRTTDNATAAAGGNIVGGTAFFFARDENIQAFDWLFVDEAGQVGLANLAAMGRAARNIVLVGDPRQLPQVIQGAHPPPADRSCLEFLLGDAVTLPPERGIFLGVSRRMQGKVCRFISEQVYEGRLVHHPEADRQKVTGTAFPEVGAWWVDVAHQGNQQVALQEVQAICEAVRALLLGQWTGKDLRPRALRASDIIVVAPYNAQVNALAEALPQGVRVGTVDKFQGQEAPVCLVSMTGSEAGESARGMEFLLSLNRINVAVSRAKALALVFGSPRLRTANCAGLDEIRLVNTLCALPLWPPRA